MALQSMKDEPGTSREYETVYILKPDVDNAGVGTLNAKVRQIMEGLGGKVLKVDNWGKRRLAFEIKKQLKGIYLYWHYLATPGVVEEVERNLRMLDNVIRYYTVKIDEDVVADARPTDLTDETFAKAGETAADEEAIMTGHARSPFAVDEDDDIDPDAEEAALRAATDVADVAPEAAAAAPAAAAAAAAAPEAAPKAAPKAPKGEE